MTTLPKQKAPAAGQSTRGIENAKIIPATAPDKVRHIALADLMPSPENDTLYKPIDPSAADIIALADSIKHEGVLEPLAVTMDGYIVSGHRRYAAAKRAGIETVPCRVLDVCRCDDIDAHISRLREYNRQRVKTHAEAIRESVIDADPEEAYASLIEHRQAQHASDIEATEVVITGHAQRAAISDAKQPFLEAIQRIVNGWRQYWPLSVRQVHYALQNAPPLCHASKPGSTYRNDEKSYNNLIDLLTRAREARLISRQAIDDDTRPVFQWDVFGDVGGFARRELDQMFKGYWRDLMQSQPDHIEIVGEKNTVLPILKPVAMQYTIPLTIGRGYMTMPPRDKIARRFQKSGKDRLVLLVASDFDPEGEDIPHSLARLLRDENGIEDIQAYKVALTAEQVATLDLPPASKAKRTSSRYKQFVERHDADNVYELEAMKPEQLRDALRRAIDSVLDIAAFNAEVDAEKQDAARLENLRRYAHEAIAEATNMLDEGDGA